MFVYRVSLLPVARAHDYSSLYNERQAGAAGRPQVCVPSRPGTKNVCPGYLAGKRRCVNAGLAVAAFCQM